MPLHIKQLEDCTGCTSPDMVKEFLFGLAYLYNRLSQDIVDSPSVETLQRKLYCTVKQFVNQL